MFVVSGYYRFWNTGLDLFKNHVFRKPSTGYYLRTGEACIAKALSIGKDQYTPMEVLVPHVWKWLKHSVVWQSQVTGILYLGR